MQKRSRHQTLKALLVVEVVVGASIHESPREHSVRVIKHDPGIGFVGQVLETTLGSLERKEYVAHVKVLQAR